MKKLLSLYIILLLLSVLLGTWGRNQMNPHLIAIIDRMNGGGRSLNEILFGCIAGLAAIITIVAIILLFRKNKSGRLLFLIGNLMGTASMSLQKCVINTGIADMISGITYIVTGVIIAKLYLNKNEEPVETTTDDSASKID